MATHTYGGGIDQTAIIGHAPEHRDWRPGDPAVAPIIMPGARIEAFVTVDAGRRWATIIGPDVWLMKHVHIGHDSVIGSGAELSPGVVIGGHCVIGVNVRLGINSCVRPEVRIGAGARIGCGTVVVCDVPPGEVWVGCPARVLRTVAEIEAAEQSGELETLSGS